MKTISDPETQEPEVKKSKDYEAFLHITGNRGIDVDRVNEIIEKIKKQNLLFCNPIIVKPSLEIIDGQHRLQAAKSLGVPIYYIVADISDDSMIDLNTAKGNWKIEDFVNWYAKRGNTNYESLMTFCRKFKISYGLSFSFLGMTRKHLKRDLVSGKFVFPHEKIPFAECKINNLKLFISRVIMELNNTESFSLISSFSFWEAIGLLPDNLDFEKFFNLLRENITLIRRCGGHKNYIRQFESINLISICERNG